MLVSLKILRANKDSSPMTVPGFFSGRGSVLQINNKFLENLESHLARRSDAIRVNGSHHDDRKTVKSIARILSISRER